MLFCYDQRMSPQQHMSPHDEQRLADFVATFIDGAGIAPPFHLVCIGSNGSISVSRYSSHGDIEQMCQHTGR